MEVNRNRVEFLLEKFSANDLSEAEFNELCELINENENEPAIKAKVHKDLENAAFASLDQTVMDRMLEKVLSQGERPVKRMFNWKRFASAAAIIIILGIGSYLAVFKTNERSQIARSPVPAQKDVAPGKDGAILTLADGSQIVLDNEANGKITDAAVKHGNVLSYENASTAEVVYNTMSTPKGREYSLVLPDGSKVWLNAASSIRFPTAFPGVDRTVEVTGEAYFEVVHDAAKPFHVSVNDMDVQVLGTHFNINAYDDESDLKTTLVEGSVLVTSKSLKRAAVLKPGQQSVLDDNELQVNKNVDTDEITAWKNGQFVFNSARLDVIMRQIARWYDVEIEYKGQIPQEGFTGIVSRKSNLSEVLNIVKQAGVKFEMHGKKITVTP
ncbi:MAG TPA: FecR domain-containing protein [Flavisolibacter sp.]|nr:FecR domain-containing protein [Flavisolibacter sp.]